jgi:phage FluMu protein Com
MKELNERVSYLRGLADGLDVGNDTKEGRLLKEMLEVMGQFAEAIDDLEMAQSELEDYVESINEDLNDLEDEVYEEEEDLDECDCGCDEMDEFVDVECPKCHEIVCFEADILEDEDCIEVTCPNCNEVVFINDGDMLEMDEDDLTEQPSSKIHEDI